MILDLISNVDSSYAKNYISLAKEILSKDDREDVLAKALCILSGHHQSSFSLLNGTEGFTTLRVSSTKEPVSKVSAVSFLHKLGGKNFGLAQICPDGSTVIDCETVQVPSLLNTFKKLRSNKTTNVEIVTEIPSVTPSDQVLSFRQGAIAMDELYSPIVNQRKE